MTRKKKKIQEDNQQDDFAAELISQINKVHNENIAFNLDTDDAPTHIKRWISTGSRQLDFLIANQLNGGLPEGRIVEIQGPVSCHAAGDRVVLYDGRTIAVENVKVGMKLMGPNGTSRTVLETHQGKNEKMYKILPSIGGKKYTVTENHILVLHRANGYTKNPNSPKSKQNDVVCMSVKDYLQQSKTFKKMYRLRKTSIKSFPGRNSTALPIPPYILGLLLGGGCLKETRVELTTEDKPIKECYQRYLSSIGYEMSVHLGKNKNAVGLCHRTNVYAGKPSGIHNPEQDKLRMALRQLELLNTSSGTKHIPDVYKLASTPDRLELLAGLIDTNGYLNKNINFDYVSKSKQLAEDIEFLCNSLGLRVSLTQKHVQNKNKGKELLYYRLCISGNVVMVPTRLGQKQALPPKNKTKTNNQHLIGFKVGAVKQQSYYGFLLDKDHLYLTDDFTVYHNSGKTHVCYEIAKSTQQLGGIVVYIDTENATSLQNLMLLGIDVKRKFVFVQTACTEDIFQVCEETILKARAMTKDVPVTIVWDSIAASSPKAELEGAYDKDTIGLQARTLGRGFRKIVNIIGNQNVLMVLVNQQRVKIGCVSPSTKIQFKIEQ